MLHTPKNPTLGVEHLVEQKARKIDACNFVMSISPDHSNANLLDYARAGMKE